MLGKPEKRELELLILERFVQHYEQHGSEALLQDGVRVVVNGDGVRLDGGETPNPLAQVPIRELFTALCYVDAGTLTLPRDALETLATEATSVLAAQINRLLAS